MKKSFWDGLTQWNVGTNVQITTTGPNGAHSESSVAINPLNAKNIIAVSKNFTDRANYVMTVTPSYSLDGGKSWNATPLTLAQGWGGMTDPDIVFTPAGVAVLMTEGLAYTPDAGDEGITTLAMVVFRSTDGGKTWSGPITLHAGDPTDDKGWIACDTLAGSPYHGRLYSVWGADSPIRFARSLDGGVTWKGAGTSASGSQLAVEGYAPAICSGPDGVIHIAWHDPGSSVINYVQSTDGGDSFSAARTIVTGITSLTSALPNTDGWPHFPGATFRVMTLCTMAATKDNHVVIAWADMREGVSRIYQVWSTDSGNNWQGGAAGQQLLPNYPVDQQHHFHPQLSTADPRTLGCAFYEFGPKPMAMGIDVRLTTKAPFDTAFVAPGTVTDQPWDPAVAAPFSHGDTNVTFIGEYFGLAGTSGELVPVWTDTRTGAQDLFCAVVLARSFFPPPPVWPQFPWPPIPPEIWGQIVFGVVNDGGGLIIVGGRPVPVPPWGPITDILQALAALSAVQQIGQVEAQNARVALWRTIGSIARAGEKGELGGGLFG
jgi:hypothetical protein